MNPLSQIAKSLVRKSGEASSAPFYSAIDKSLSSLPNKALGDQFIKEMLKSGVKPQEIIDRNIDVILGSPIVKKTRTVKLKKPDKKGRTEIEEKYFEVTPSAKGSKAIKREDVERIAAENPPPSITEKVDKGPSEIKYKVEYDDLNDRYDVVDDYSNVVKSFRDYDDAQFYAGKLEGGTSKYEQYQLPGGKNYREIKLMLPLNKRLEFVDKRINELQPIINQQPIGITPERREYSKLWEEKELLNKSSGYKSSHFSEPNILAHARVSDRTGPNGEKILHVEEIQSDWHQTGRKEGYQKPATKNLTGYVREHKSEFGFSPEYEVRWSDGTFSGGYGSAEEAQKRLIEGKTDAVTKGVPEAPFKQNWHELVMKRLLDDAAKKGYDKVVITPGAEQAKRYDLSKHFGEISYKHNEDGTVSIVGTDKKSGLANLHEEDIPKEKIQDYVGKELAEKIMNNVGTPYEGNSRMRQGSMTLSNLDLKVGGEGMKGFYDQMLPAFLNDYGKKWGARVESMKLPTPPKNSMDVQGYPLGEEYIQGQKTWSEFLAANPRAIEEFNTPVHSFTITPQMREDIVGKGQPLYQAIPAGVGAGTLAAPQEEVPEQPMKKGGAVGMDAMRMAVMNKQLRKRHG